MCALPGIAGQLFCSRKLAFLPSAIQASTSDWEILSFLPLPVSSHLGPPLESNAGHSHHTGQEI